MATLRHVLVTGASRGIGFHVAKAFAACGDRLTLIADDAGIRDAAQRLGATGHVADVTDRAGIDALFATLEPIDVLVSNAGIGDITPIDDRSKAAGALFDRLIAINLTGAYNVVRAAVPRISDGGRIIFTSSVHGQGIAPPNMSAYAASKGGLDALMRSLARELGPRRINVNAVAPGMVATDLTMGAIRKLFAAQLGDAGAPDEAEMVAMLNEGQAIHRLPVDIARLAAAYLFLASDAGAAITGQVLNVDHGLSMK